MSSNAGRLNLSAGRGKISIASGENSTREVFRIRVVHWYAPHLREGNTGVVDVSMYDCELCPLKFSRIGSI